KSSKRCFQGYQVQVGNHKPNANESCTPRTVNNSNSQHSQHEAQQNQNRQVDNQNHAASKQTSVGGAGKVNTPPQIPDPRHLPAYASGLPAAGALLVDRLPVSCGFRPGVNRLGNG